MNEQRRRILAYAVLARRGLISPEAAAVALGFGGSMSPTAADPVADTVRPGTSVVVGEAEPLQIVLARLDAARREDVQRELRELSDNAVTARKVVAESGLSAAALAAWDGAAAVVAAPTGVPIPIQPPAEPRYTLRKEHARGGMGRVLIVADASIGRDIALKEILFPSTPGAGPVSIGTYAEHERFLREARITGQLEHPNIVPVHEIGRRADGAPYYTMKFVRGESMADRLKAIGSGPGDADERLAKRLKLLDAFVDVCQAVAYAHSRGVINRDLKPANVMLGDYGETFVLDWGLAKIEGQEDRTHAELLKHSVAHSRAVTPGTGDSTKLTLDGSIMGTPSYMPPEQARGEIEDVDRQSDVYSLGAILYEILTGHPPFEGPDLTRILQSVILLEPLPVLKAEPRAPRELAALAHRAMARDKAARLPSARILAEELQAFRDGRQLAGYRYSFREQVARFARRNRALAGALLFSFTALAVAAAVSLRWAGVASRESSNALRALGTARTAEAAARRSSEEASVRAEKEREAKEATQRALVFAEGQRLAAVATPIAASNPGQALVLAIEAAKRAPGLASNNAMLTSLLRLCEHRRLWEHALPCTCGRFNASGHLAASGGMDFVARVWDVEKGTQLRQFDDHGGTVRDVEFSPDSNLLATACDDGVVRLWWIDDGTLHESFKGHVGAVKGLQFFDGGRRLLSWSEDGTARIWALDAKPPVVLDGAGAPLTRARVSIDGSRVVTLSKKGDALLWDLPAARKMATLDAGPIAAVDLSPDGTLVATASEDGRGDLWETAGGAHQSRPFTATTNLRGALFSPDGTRVAFLDRLGLHVFDVASREPRGTLQFDGDLLADRLSADWSKWVDMRETEAVLRSTKDGSVIERFQGHDYELASYAFSPDLRHVLTASHDRNCAVWHLEPGAALAGPEALTGRFLLAQGQGGLRAVTRDADDRARLIEIGTGKTVMEFGPPADPVVAAPTGDLIAVPGAGSVRVIDTREGALAVEIPIPEAAGAFRSGFAPDGSALWTWPTGGHASVWDPRTGKRIGDVDFQGATGLALSPGGAVLAAGNTSHGVIGLFDVASGKLLRSLTGHTGTMLGLAFFPDGRFLISTAADATARVWEVATGKQVAAYRWPRADVISPAVSPDGKYASLLGGGFARILDASTLREIFTVTPEFAPDAVAFTPDSEAFLFRSTGGRWRRVPIDLLALALREAPRPITPSEMNRFEVGTEAERKTYSESFQAVHPSVFGDWIAGMQAINAGDFAKAVASFRHASAALPHHPDSACYLAQGLCAAAKSLSSDDPRRRANVDEALDQLDTAARLGCSEEEWLQDNPWLRILEREPRYMGILLAFRRNRTGIR